MAHGRAPSDLATGDTVSAAPRDIAAAAGPPPKLGPRAVGDSTVPSDRSDPETEITLPPARGDVDDHDLTTLPFCRRDYY